MKLKKSHPGAYKMDSALIASIVERIREIVSQAFLKFEEPSVDLVRERLLRPMHQPQEKILPMLRSKYIAWAESNLKPNTVKQRKQILNHLDNFEKKTKKTLTSTYVTNLDFYNDYIKFAYETAKLSANTVGVHIKRIKTFLYFLEKLDLLTINQKLKLFKSPSQDNDPIFLNDDEISRINSVDLTDHPHLMKYRDLFKVGIKTGLRMSDLLDLRKENIISVDGESLISRTIIKTQRHIELPVYGELLAIFRRYTDSGKFIVPRVSAQKFNKYLKELGELAGVDQQVEIKRKVKADCIVDSKPKYKVMCAHMLRRTFITQCAFKGMPINVIQGFSGHSDIRTLRRYIGVAERKVKMEQMRKLY